MSQWSCRGNPFLMHGGSESVSEGAPAGAALVSPEETLDLVKGLKEELAVSSESAVGRDTRRSSGDSSQEFVVPLPSRVRPLAPGLVPVTRGLPLSVRLALIGLVVPVSRLA